MERVGSRLLMEEFSQGENAGYCSVLILPTLANAIGLNAAIMLQRVHQWLLDAPSQQHATAWVVSSFSQWHAQFPFWSMHTIRRTMQYLEAIGVLRSEVHNSSALDKTKAYTINYAKLSDTLEHGPDPVPRDTTIARKRQDIQKRYATLFTALGTRDGFFCQHCTATENLHIDHKHPVSMGGTNALRNLQLLCGACNSRKGARIDR